MALNKLYYVYGLDTACLYTPEESAIEQKIIKARCLRATLKDRIAKQKITPCLCKGKRPIANKDSKTPYVGKHQKRLRFLNDYIASHKALLKQELAKNVSLTRTVIPDKLNIRRQISIFGSSLTRYFNLKERELNEEIVIVKVYFFDVAKSIVKNGFYMNGHKYVFFSSSAGQIRTKKLVAVREDLLNKYWNALTAGLTIEKINEQGGMNVNKFLAYLALCNSATDLWCDFNIDECIVVDDFETLVHGTVDFIDDKTYRIERQEKNIPITHTDGCGMILPELSTKNFMTRLPWVKGLLASFDFVKFIKDNNCDPVITDVYGDKHNILEENIKIIFTKSQFKMWKYYSNWSEYKNNFKKYGSTAGKCNIEEGYIPCATINYQMIQTLIDTTDNEIAALAHKSMNDIRNLATDKATMLKVFGATGYNKNMNGFQKCLKLYPELLSDPYSRATLKDIKHSLETDQWAAKFKTSGKYTFVVPDLYAFCEYLFLHISNPKGLLSNGEVSCKLFKDNIELDCLRSPHLYIEHAIRTNRHVDSWFNTDAIYTSCADCISKVLQFDNDGDKLLVIPDETLINLAKRNLQKYDIVPLFYNMAKAGAKELTPDSLYDGLICAYTGGNIGEISNAITKVWNSGVIDQEKINVVKWLCMENNFVIDYAKTLYKPVRPDWVNEIISKHVKSRVPHFFQYAKGKEINQVEERGLNTVDRIKSLTPIQKLNFNFKNDNVGKFDYRFLLKNKEIEVDENVLQRFRDISSNLRFCDSDGTALNYQAVYDQAKEEMLMLGHNIDDVVDMLVEDLFHSRRVEKKKAFWEMFGEVVYEHLSNNLSQNYIQCAHCQKRFYRENPKQIYCNKCQNKKSIKANTKILQCAGCGKTITVSTRCHREAYCPECKIHARNTARLRAYYKNKHLV